MNYKPEEDLSRILTPRKRVVYMADPVRFVEEIIFNTNAEKFGGTYTISFQQVEMLESIVHSRRVAAKAGRGVGKTAVLSWLIIWWLCMFEGGQVVASAPSFPQLTSVLWPEVSKWLKTSLVADYFVHTAKKLYLKSDPKNTFAEPRTASKEESAQGLHEEHLLILLDEAPGIEDKIWDTMQGSLTKANNKVFAMGNPARTSGFFFDAFHKDKAIWENLTFNSAISPNVDESWLEEMRLKYVQGEVIHDMYKVHVLGEFPSGDPDAFITLEDVTKASFREVPREGVIEIGVDVARKGDDLTCIAIRHGNYIDDLITWNKTPIDVTVDKIVAIVKDLRLETGYLDTIRIKVDDTGVGGGVTDFLERDASDLDVEIVPCNFGGAGDLNYSNEASKMWGTFKDALPNLRLPNNRFMLEELSTRKWELDGRGRILIQRKKDFKKDYGSSPDHADAVVLCTADKENEHRMVKSFNHTEDGIYPARELMHGRKFASVYLSNKNLMSAVICTYTGSQIRVVDEYIGDSSEIIGVLRQYGGFEKIIGSKNMFAMGADDIFLDYMSNGLNIQESYGYDQYGATRMLESLASKNGLKTAIECEQTTRQLRSWKIDSRTTHERKEEPGLCFALLHIVSELTMQNSITTNEDYFNGGYKEQSVFEDVNSGFMAM